MLECLGEEPIVVLSRFHVKFLPESCSRTLAEFVHLRRHSKQLLISGAMPLPYPTTEDRAYIHTFNIECRSLRNEHSIVQSFWMVAEHEFISVAELPRFARIESVLVDLADGAVWIPHLRLDFKAQPIFVGFGHWSADVFQCSGITNSP